MSTIDNNAAKQFGARQNGARTSFFCPTETIKVLVEPMHADDNDSAFALATELADAHVAVTKARSDAIAAMGRAEALERELAFANSRVAPKAPARLLGPGFVRFTESGELWLLGKRETGWAAFGFRCDSWDDLFRRYDVRVTAHGSDEHGMWWKCENR
jgi:hypothetical protein